MVPLICTDILCESLSFLSRGQLARASFVSRRFNTIILRYLSTPFACPHITVDAKATYFFAEEEDAHYNVEKWMLPVDLLNQIPKYVRFGSVSFAISCDEDVKRCLGALNSSQWRRTDGADSEKPFQWHNSVYEEFSHNKYMKEMPILYLQINRDIDEKQFAQVLKSANFPPMVQLEFEYAPKLSSLFDYDAIRNCLCLCVKSHSPNRQPLFSAEDLVEWFFSRRGTQFFFDENFLSAPFGVGDSTSHLATLIIQRFLENNTALRLHSCVTVSVLRFADDSDIFHENAKTLQYLRANRISKTKALKFDIVDVQK